MSFSLEGTPMIGEVLRRRLEASNLLEYANSNRNVGIFNDVEICAGSDSFPANRLVLSCFSSFFEKMFKVEMKEKYEKSVEINCIDSNSMKSLIDFVYTGRITINIENVCNLLSASDYLQIEEVKQFCFDFVEEVMTPNNCFTIIDIADFYQNDVLKNKTIKFITDKFDEVTTSDRFKNFTKDELSMFISMYRTKNVEAISVYKAIICWTKHDEESRVNNLHELIQLVNLHDLPYDFLEEVVKKESIIICNVSCSNMLLNAFARQLKELRFEKSGSRILCLGGNKTMSEVSEIYNCLDEPAKKYPNLPDGRYCGCCVKLEKYLYHIGGNLCKNNSTKTVWKLNLAEKNLKWKKVNALIKSRAGMGATVFHGSIVVVGGGDMLTTGESYSSLLNSWSPFPKLQQARSGNALISCQDYLYAIGGFGNDQHLSSVESMSLDDGRWEYRKAMQTPRVWCSAVSYNGFVYVIGGQTGEEKETRLKSVEKYDSCKNEWVYVADMNFKRVGCSACVMQGRIFVVGGVNETGTVVKEIKCYDPLLDKWSIVGETDEELCNHSLVVV